MSTVETSSTVYTMDNLTHELTPPFIDKIGTNAQYQSIDQHAHKTMDSPRISSTPPSTPDLDSNHGKEMKDDDLDGDNDSNDNENDNNNDFYDYGYNDYDDYLDDDYSEPDEDYFFKDFAEAADTNGDTKTTTPGRRPKSKRYSRRHQSQKAMSRFDLQSFARQLHANRLSVLQTRQSRMILTEEDEQELNKLLARKHSLDDTSPLTPPPVPALPSLPIDASSTPTETSESVKTKQQQHQDTSSNDNDSSAITVTDASQELAGPIPRLSLSSSAESIKKNSILLQKLDNQPPSIKTSNDASLDDVAPHSPSLSDPSSLASPSHPEPVSPSESTSSSNSSSTSANNDSKILKATPLPLATSTSTSFTVKKKPSWIISHLKQSPIKNKHQPSDVTTSPKPRRSMSVDTLRDQARQHDSWKKKTTSPPTSAKKTTTDDSSENESKPVVQLADQTKKPKLRLFGSLRQASRSSRTTGEGTFRGLMRNLSTVGQRQQQPASMEQLDQHVTESAMDNINSNTSNNATSTISQAAMAVIHHDASVKKEKLANKKEKTAATATPTTAAPELSTKIEVNDDMMMDGMDDTTEQVTHTATTAKGGVRLLTNLLAKARSARRSQKKLPKQNSNQQQQQQDADDEAPKQERNKVIRRTIIYVKPDALDFMKDGHLPPIPAPKNRHLNKSDDDDDDDGDDLRFSKDTMMDDTVEYATATKLTRQTSRRKRLVENPTDTTSPAIVTTKHLDNNNSNNKKWHLESVSEFDLGKSSGGGGGDDDMDGQLEGLELREMSDGSVVWGIVKKQGNRKSFFATKSTHLDRSATDQQPQPQSQPQDDIEKSVLALMGLGPDSLDHLPAAPVMTTRKSKRVPPPIPKRSPRRLEQQQQQQQQQQQLDDDTRRLQRGLSVEEQLDEMMLSIKQSQF